RKRCRAADDSDSTPAGVYTEGDGLEVRGEIDDRGGAVFDGAGETVDELPHRHPEQHQAVGTRGAGWRSRPGEPRAAVPVDPLIAAPEPTGIGPGRRLLRRFALHVVDHFFHTRNYTRVTGRCAGGASTLPAG